MVQGNRSRSQKRNNARRNSKQNKRGGANMFSPNNPSFAAKLAAFMLDDHQGEVRWSENGGFHESQTQIFGVLPFLHLNVTENTFKEMLEKGRCKETRVLTKACKNKGLDTELTKVDFSCSKQSNKGVRALVLSTVSSINNLERWNARTNGRRVLEFVREKMNLQVQKGLITSKSLEWSQ